MEKKRFAFKEVPVEIRCALFKGKEGINEYHLSFSPIKRESFQMQLKWIYEAYIKTLEILTIEEETCVFRRFFCSDLYNQLIYLKEMDFSNPENNSNLVGISLICQPPGPFARISMWAYHVKDNKKNIEKEKMGNTISLKRDNLIHNWTTGLFNNKLDSVYEQTKNIIETYLNLLKEKNMKLSENVIRTWFFLKNIDTDYKDFVVARREIYAQNGLTPDTHFIASTGVGGSYYDVKAKVVMDAYSISGLYKKQIKFLMAPEYLSPTYIYGVTFERGVSISYSDRKHIIISGTASINNKGEIMYERDINLQTERTLTNIQALLKNENANLDDIMIFVVYVRDPIDWYFVEKKMKSRFKDTPIIFANASVCRPGWLVEIEGIAVVPSLNSELPSFL